MPVSIRAIGSPAPRSMRRPGSPGSATPPCARPSIFPALAAIRWNPLVAALRQRLKDQGRLKPKQIVAAAMRKLLHLCFGVLKTGKPFDPDHATSTDETAATT